MFSLLLVWTTFRTNSCSWFQIPRCSLYSGIYITQNWGGGYWNNFLRSITWGHQMETFSILLAICAGNSPVTGEFLAQRPVTQSFDVFFDMHLNKRLSKQSWGWWFEMPSSPLWCHCYDFLNFFTTVKTLATYWISHSNMTGVTAALLRWYLSNIKIIERTKKRYFSKMKYFLTREINKWFQYPPPLVTDVWVITEGLADILVAPIRRQNMFKPGMGAWWWCQPKQHARVCHGSRTSFTAAIFWHLDQFCHRNTTRSILARWCPVGP